MPENDQVQNITRNFLKEFVPKNIPDEAKFVDIVCDEYFKAVSQPDQSGKKNSVGMKFIDPALATFVTPILASILASIAKSLVDNWLARKNKKIDEKEVQKAIGKHKELDPELVGTFATAIVKFINENPKLLTTK
jgi:hypothetical protein